MRMLLPSRLAIVLLLGLMLLTPAARAGPPVAPATQPARDADQVAAEIDRFIAERWRAAGVKPAPGAGEAEYLRRLTLDLAGRIPRVSEARDFLDDQRTDKRRQAVERFLGGGDYAGHFANVLRARLLPDTGNPQLVFFLGQFEGWMRKQLRENTPYDKMVKQLLTVPSMRMARFGGFGGGSSEDMGPFVFYQAYEYKPELLGGAASRSFLGINIECAQCHNHKTASWTREQFWQFAAFFAAVQSPLPGQVDPKAFAPKRNKQGLLELTIPNTDRVVVPTYLDGTSPQWSADPSADPRELLATWITAKDNPYFARAVANQIWAHFFGAGLVEPLDDMSEANPASHPEVLDLLAAQFAAHDYDLRFLIRTIVATKAYQLSSAVPPGTPPMAAGQGRLFARMASKGLSPEQTFDSIALATGYRTQPVDAQNAFNPYMTETARGQFLTRFANRTDKPTEFQTTILQALMLMNGQFVADASSIEKSETLGAVADAPFFDTGGRVEALYLAVLSRPPTAGEAAKLVKYVESGGARKDQKKALADVMWALLNSAEFRLNH